MRNFSNVKRVVVKIGTNTLTKDAMVDTDVSLVGKGPAALILPKSAVNGNYSALVPLMGTNNVQITTMFTIFRGPAGRATSIATMTNASFAAGGGPGSFTFCPAGSGMAQGTCPPLTTGGASMNPNPPQGNGTRNGRIVYTGGSGFGGVSQILLGGGGSPTK